MGQRALAASELASGLALLAANYAWRFDAIRTGCPPEEQFERFKALQEEQRGAERALRERMAGQARGKRQAILDAVKGQTAAQRRKAYRQAAGEVTWPWSGTRPRRRDRDRGRIKAPKLKR